MALTVSTQVQNILRTWYKDDVSNLLFRNDPAVKMINKVRVEGKEQAFAAIYGAGGAVSSNFTAAKTQAAETSRNAEFKVAPGQLFSVMSMNAKEVQASLTKKGAYMKVAGNKLFAASEALRRTLAACFYGDGFGVIATVAGSASLATISTSGTEIDFAADPSVAMKLDVGSIVQFKASKTSADADSTKAEVTKIDGNKVTFKASTTISLTSGTTYYIQLQGSVDASGNPLLPMGLAGWLPTDRSGLGTSWNNVVRSAAPDRLAGAIVDDSAVSTAKHADTVQKLLMKVRRAGSMADLIVMNDEDFLKLSAEIQTTNTYFTATSTKEKKVINTGVSEITAAFSTSYIDNIVDSPYCPKGVFYILDKSAVELWSMTNSDVIDNGIVGNNAGKQDPMTMDNDGHANDPAQLIIDDYINVSPGEGDQNGPNVLVTLQLFASFVVTNPANCGVGKFYNA